MNLKEWDYDSGPSGGYVDRPYPDEVIKAFVDFMRNNNQWQDNPDLVVDRYRHFEKDLTEARNAGALALAAGDCTAITKSGRACKNTTGVVDGLCAIHRRALAAV